MKRFYEVKFDNGQREVTKEFKNLSEAILFSENNCGLYCDIYETFYETNEIDKTTIDNRIFKDDTEVIENFEFAKEYLYDLEEFFGIDRYMVKNILLNKEKFKNGIIIKIDDKFNISKIS